ncbi:MAG: site-specific DNA-methyltransferase [Alphaproteobacteria bacterium]|nr:site-specific DNA-methyltransferase [Alphaproteobacteria bacterium]
MRKWLDTLRKYTSNSKDSHIGVSAPLLDMLWHAPDCGALETGPVDVVYFDPPYSRADAHYAENDNGPWRLFHKSSEDASFLPSGCVHLVVTSPPYNVGMDYGPDVSDRLAPEAYASMLHNVFSEMHRLLADNGRMFLLVGAATNCLGWSPHTYFEVMLSQIGFRLQWSYVWDKGKISNTAWGTRESAKSPRVPRTHEYVMVLSKGDWSRKDLDSSKTMSKEDFNKMAGGTVLRMRPYRCGRHPAAFPPELPLQAIKFFSVEGDVVLDPFAGTGSTLLAAVQLGRKAIGFELSKSHYDNALSRLKAMGGHSERSCA